MNFAVDWGNAPDWLTVLGAFVALIFARSAARAAHQTNTQQAGQLQMLREVEQRREQHELRQQASRLSFWIRLVDNEEFRPAISIVNSNTTPLYQLTMYCLTRNGVLGIPMNVVAPQAEPRILRRVTVQLRALTEDIIDPIGEMDRWQLRMTGTFRDTAGNWWHRTADGSLRACKDSGDAQIQSRLEIQAFYRDLSTS